MSQNSSRPLSKFNLALALLWLVDVVVTGAGYLILSSSNAAQAEFYNAQSADYGTYFTAQSGSNLGANLIAAGVIGFIITLAALVVNRAIAHNAHPAAATHTHQEPDFGFDDETDFAAEETAPVQARAAETGTVTPATGSTTALPTESSPEKPGDTSTDESPTTR